MTDVVSEGIGLILNENDARVAVISIILCLIVFILLISFIIVAYKLKKTIETQSKGEYDIEQERKEYYKKVDDTKNDIKDLTNLITRLTEAVNTSRETTKEDIASLRKLIEEKDLKGCQYGHKSSKELAELKKEIISELMGKVQLLVDSDRERIKTFITSEYHHWMDKGYIDIYTLKGIEERFDKYRKEDGNTFVEDMMKELRALSRTCITTNCTEPMLVQEKNECKVREPHSTMVAEEKPDEL